MTIVKGIANGCPAAGLSIGGRDGRARYLSFKGLRLSGFAVGLTDKSHLLGAMNC